MSVLLDLDGGLHDHLGVVISPSENNFITGHAYNCPKYPGLFDIHDTIWLCEEHNQKLQKNMSGEKSSR